MKRDFSIFVVKTKAFMSFAVTMKLICVCFFCTCSKLFFMARHICRAITKSVFEPGLTQTRLCIYIHSKMVYV